MALPEVEETSHFLFHTPVFKVRGRTFLGMGKGETTVVFRISEQEANAAAAADPATCAAVRRQDARRSFLGLQVELGIVSGDRLRSLSRRHGVSRRRSGWPLTRPTQVSAVVEGPRVMSRGAVFAGNGSAGRGLGGGVAKHTGPGAVRVGWITGGSVTRRGASRSGWSLAVPLAGRDRALRVWRRRGQDPAERLAAVPPGACLSGCAGGVPGAAPGRSGWWWGMAAAAGSRWCTGRGGTRRWCPEGREWRGRNRGRRTRRSGR